MAFAVKYRMSWTDRLGGDAYRLDVETDGYLGSIIELGHTVDGFELIYNDRDWVQGFEGIFSFHLLETDSDSYDTDFYDSQYKDFKVKFYINDVVKNVGWLKPENTTRELVGPIVQYRVSFTDALIDLEKVDYTGFEGSGFQPLLQIIKNALNLGGITDFDFWIQCNLYENTLMLSTESLFKFFLVNNLAFYDIQEGKTKPDKCYTVIEKCIKPFYCRLAQVDGYWQITNGQEYNSQRDIYAWADLVAITEDVVYNRIISIENFRVAGSRFEFSKLPPIQTLRTTFRNRKIGSNELTNGHFTDDTTGWLNGTEAGEEQWTTFNVLNNKLNLAENDGTGNPNLTKSFRSIPFTIAEIGEGTGFFYLSFKMNLKSITYVEGEYSSAPPLYKLSLAYPTPEGTITQSERAIALGEATYELSIPELWPADKIGDYVLTITYEPNVAAVLSLINLEISDIRLSQNAMDQGDTTDIEYHHFSDSGVPGYLSVEEELYFADNAQISESGTMLEANLIESPSKWTRWGQVTENASLITQFSKQYLNDRRGYFDKISIEGLLDENEVIHFNSILLLNTKTYRFIEVSKNYKKKTISGTIQQVDNNTDFGITALTKSLFAQWGIPFKDLKRFSLPGRTLLPDEPYIYKGIVGIGGVHPKASLHLPKGKAGPSLAPLKFTLSDVDPVTNDGARLATPEDGAVEYYQTIDGDHHLTMTIDGTRYEMTNRVFLETIDTSSSVITFDMGNQTQKLFKGSTNILREVTWEFINDDKFVQGRFNFLAAAFVDYNMPDTVTMSDSRFLVETRKWRPNDLGVYEARFFKDGGYYQIQIFGPFLGLNNPPEIVNNVISYDSINNVLGGSRTYFDLEGDLENNPPPEALDIDTTGTGEIGVEHTLVYTFYSPSGYAFSNHDIQWYRSDEDGTNEEEIPAQTGISYLTEAIDLGKLIYPKFTVTQIADAPANGNPTSATYTGVKVLIQDLVLGEAAETIQFGYSTDAEVTAGSEPVITWLDKLIFEIGQSVSATYATDVNPALTNLGTGSNWTTEDATKPTHSTDKLVFANAHRVVGSNRTFPPVFELFLKGRFTANNGAMIGWGSQTILGINSSNQFYVRDTSGIALAGDLNEHVFRIRLNGVNSIFQIDGGVENVFTENFTNASTLVLGQTYSGGNPADCEIKRVYIKGSGELLTTQEVADMWAYLGF